MHSSIVILSKGTDGGTGTLSIRISEWCKANDVKMGYASVRNTNSLNTNSMKNNQVTIEFDDDLTYHTQYKRLLLCENTLILTYTLLDYYYAELLQKQYEQIKKIILYQVGFGSIPYETKHGSKLHMFLAKCLCRLANRYYITNLLKTHSFLVMDEQNRRMTEESANVSIEEQCVAYLPYKFVKSSFSSESIDLPHKYVITSICRFEFPFKAYVIGLIGTYEKLRKAGYDIQLVLIGDGKGKNEVINRIDLLEESLKEDIILPGVIAYEELEHAFKNTTLYVGMGTTVLDATNYGRIAVVAALGTYDIEVKGTFLDYPYEVGLDSGIGTEGKLLEIVKKTYNYSADEYSNYVNKQLSEVKKAFDIEWFMKRILENEERNFCINEHKFAKLKFALLSKR